MTEYSIHDIKAMLKNGDVFSVVFKDGTECTGEFDCVLYDDGIDGDLVLFSPRESVPFNAFSPDEVASITVHDTNYN